MGAAVTALWHDIMFAVLLCNISNDEANRIEVAQVMAHQATKSAGSRLCRSDLECIGYSWFCQKLHYCHQWLKVPDFSGMLNIALLMHGVVHSSNPIYGAPPDSVVDDGKLTCSLSLPEIMQCTMEWSSTLLIMLRKTPVSLLGCNRLSGALPTIMGKGETIPEHQSLRGWQILQFRTKN